MTRDRGALLREIRPVARSYFREGMDPTHDWFHVRRVETNAERLVAKYPEADTGTVLIAALLHDIGRAREANGEIADHAEWGTTEGERILREHGVTGETADSVVHCIRAHRYSNRVTPETIEAKIVSDADDLDALGAVGLARCFAHGGARGTPIHDPSLAPGDDPTDAGETQYNHVHKKLLDLPDRMYTDAGRDVAEARAEFVREFARRFEAEMAGER